MLARWRPPASLFRWSCRRVNGRWLARGWTGYPEARQPVSDLRRPVVAQSGSPVEEILMESINRAQGEAPVEWLSDEEIFTLCDSQMDDGLQEELSDLLERRQEGEL